MLVSQYAKEKNVRVMVDAEQSYFQPAIHRLTIEMMRKYNTESAIVFNTQQCYLKKALKTVTLDLEQAKRQNFYYGKLLIAQPSLNNTTIPTTHQQPITIITL